MATTTNYSWTTPDDTALVKDGAAAIRSLGTAIDSTVFTNAGNAIAKTIVDAKGDIIAATAADTVSRLAVDANDTVLTADSSTATGLKWAASSAGGMTLLSTTTLSGASTLISGINQSYTNLIIVAHSMTNSTADGSFQVEINTLTSGQGNQVVGFTANGSTITDNAKDNNFINVADVDRTSNENVFFINLQNYANTTFFKPVIFYGTYMGTSSTNRKYGSFGCHRTTSAITDIQFANSGGNWSTGTVLVYGVK